MIEVDIERLDEPVPEYPYLGIASNNCVVLFTRRDSGSCLYPGGSAHHVGEYGDSTWNEEGFKPLDGAVTLRNID